MNLLLDSHVLIWSMAGDQRLPQHIGALLVSGQNQLFFSSASLWEIGIKYAQGRLSLEGGFDSVVEFMHVWNIQLLPITIPHIRATAALPFHHGDPFDRMLVAQAKTEGFRLVSGDAKISLYQLDVVW